MAAVIAFPVLSASSVGSSPVADVNDDALETIGWPQFTDWVAAGWHGLPARERERGVVLTANYGEAGAINRFGGSRGLPRAYSGHNSFSSFGRPRVGAGPVLVVGYIPGIFPAHGFRDCRVASRFDNGFEVDNEEQGARRAVCRAPQTPWHELWPRLHHLNA